MFGFLCYTPAMLFWKLVGGVVAKVGLGFSLLFSPGTPLPLWPMPSTPLVLAPHTEEIANSEQAETEKIESETPESKPITIPKPQPIAVPIPSPVEAPTPQPVSPPQPVQVHLPPGSNLNDATRDALVNILCITKAGGYLKPISGSGVIVDSHGIVLTNAHVGQFFLLRNYTVKDNVTCTIRTGSPARNLYTAELLYLPPTWIAANARKIVQEVPTGTGRNDYAFLRITGRTDPAASLPPSFPFIPPTLRDPVIGEGVLLAGYPAGFIEGETVQTNLYSSSAKTSISAIYTFEEGGGSDLISVGGTILSQHGSSGGVVVTTQEASAIGTIVTATDGVTTAERDLRAITFRHIDESYRRETGEGLNDLFSSDFAQKASIFNLTIVPSLSRALIDELEK